MRLSVGFLKSQFFSVWRTTKKECCQEWGNAGYADVCIDKIMAMVCENKIVNRNKLFYGEWNII